MSANSGSSSGSRRGFRPSTVTSTPNRAKIWANSMAIVPPPMMARECGSRGSVTASTLVMNPASRSPGIGGMNARAPVVRIKASPRSTSPLTSTSFAEMSRACPLRRSIPASEYCGHRHHHGWCR